MTVGPQGLNTLPADLLRDLNFALSEVIRMEEAVLAYCRSTGQPIPYGFEGYQDPGIVSERILGTAYPVIRDGVPQDVQDACADGQTTVQDLQRWERMGEQDEPSEEWKRGYADGENGVDPLTDYNEEELSEEWWSGFNHAQLLKRSLERRELAVPPGADSFPTAEYQRGFEDGFNGHANDLNGGDDYQDGFDAGKTERERQA